MRTSLPIALVLSLASVAACTSKEAARTSDSTVAAASTTASAASTTASAAPTTEEGKIQNAMSAAPDSVSQGATIMDWPATAGGKFTQLRAGTNGWVCYPSNPATGVVGQDPMCLDAEFQKWAGAWMTKQKSPKLTGVGVAYMLQGDRGASVADPFAK